MLRWGRWSLVVACALLGAQCAIPVSRLPQLPENEIEAERRIQQVAQMRAYYEELHRVDNVAFRIRTANVADCTDRVTAQIGLYAVTPQSLPRRYRSYAHDALDITWARPTIISIADGSPAAQAGIVKGDEIISLNGELIPVSDTTKWMRKWLTRNGTKVVEAVIRRAGEDQTITITPVMGCSIPINYVTAEEANAATDGEQIVIQSGMVELAKTDAQLAAVIGHELAHANLGHIEKQQINTLIGFAGGVVIDGGFFLGGISTGGAFRRELTKAGGRAHSVAFEREADYVGAYYIARAGYDLAGVEELWRALAMKTPDAIRLARTHPTSPVRFLQMQKVAAEIVDKKARGLPLNPDLRFVQTEQPPSQSGELMR
ncbi:M48 family metallopeptidase [Microbacteriaceae bacterium K1510]|nr:M48 family metallopeptidase [Microbacteriaceae bacterium K1510]